LKRMKRVLIRRLARHGESYSYAPLEIPDNVDIEDPAMKKRRERRERERERKEALRAAKRMQKNAEENKSHLTESNLSQSMESKVQSSDGKSSL
uniref:Brix domain-containing protein n=1 Tax=Angiostrongylus cantonensis TaxID=6313 RepID=A0A0K0D833_ANGCA